MNPFVYLALAIISEVVATSALRASDGFTKLWPSLLMVVGYGIAFYLVSLCVRQIPIGTAYAIWAGVGTAGTVLIGVVLWRDEFNLWHGLGIGLIIAGVVMLNLFTKAHA